MKKNLIKTAAAMMAAVVTMTTPIPAFALRASNDDFIATPEYIEETKDIAETLGFNPTDWKWGMSFIMAEGSNREETKANMQKKLDSMQHVSAACTKKMMLDVGGKQYLLDREGAQYMIDVIEKGDAWLAGNLPVLAPSGTPVDTAIRNCANWLADNVSYDWENGDEYMMRTHYQSSYAAFYEGKGICATYAKAFNAMVNYLPLTNGVVDWENGTTHLRTDYLLGRDHAWSGVQMSDGDYRQYDITNYAINKKSDKYYEMTAETLASRGAYVRSN